MHSHKFCLCLLFSLVHQRVFLLLLPFFKYTQPHIALYSLIYFVHIGDKRRQKEEKNAAHTFKRHSENFAVFLLRPIFFQDFKVKYSKHFFFGVSCCSVVDVLKLVDCVNCAKISFFYCSYRFGAAKKQTERKKTIFIREN
jgi:hypothetical protein